MTGAALRAGAIWRVKITGATETVPARAASATTAPAATFRPGKSKLNREGGGECYGR